MKHVEAVQAAPPVSVVGLTLFGYPIAEWVYVATLLYTVFLIIDKTPVVVSRLRKLVHYLGGKNDQGDCN